MAADNAKAYPYLRRAMLTMPVRSASAANQSWVAPVSLFDELYREGTTLIAVAVCRSANATLFNI